MTTIAGAPVGQIAYQTTLMKSYANAWNPYVQTVNRYMSGYSGVILAGVTGELVAMPQRPVRVGRRLGFFPVGGAAMQVTSSGGSGYVAHEVVTFAPINGGRSVVVAVDTVSAGAPATFHVIDPGSGMTGGGTGVNSTSTQTASLTQLSSTGVGSGATWAAILGIGLGLGALPRADA